MRGPRVAFARVCEIRDRRAKATDQAFDFVDAHELSAVVFGLRVAGGAAGTVSRSVGGVGLGVGSRRASGIRGFGVDRRSAPADDGARDDVVPCGCRARRVCWSCPRVPARARRARACRRPQSRGRGLRVSLRRWAWRTLDGCRGSRGGRRFPRPGVRDRRRGTGAPPPSSGFLPPKSAPMPPPLNMFDVGRPRACRVSHATTPETKRHIRPSRGDEQGSHAFRGFVISSDATNRGRFGAGCGLGAWSRLRGTLAPRDSCRDVERGKQV